ncbi:MAG: BBE domain-containing protein [Pseudomonadota bacterium]
MGNTCPDHLGYGDENLGRRADRFTTDAKLARLDGLRAKYDPDNLFNAWMGRVAPAARRSA